MENSSIFGFETDTVWGLGCSAQNKDAVEKIYKIKGRETQKPLILMSYKMENLLKYVEDVSDEALFVMKRHWPAALTVILKKSSICPALCISDVPLQTVALRIPNHPLFKDVCMEAPDGVLATTSLNFSHEPPCANYEEALEKFGNVCKIFPPKRDFIKENIPSTIVDFTKTPHVILRQGTIKL